MNKKLKGLACLVAVWAMAPWLVAQTADQASELTVGSVAPAFAVRSLDGQNLDLAAMRGKVVVLNFWFIACPPCRVEMPKLNRLVQSHVAKSVVFIGFSPDSPEQLREFLAQIEFKYFVVPNSTDVAVRYKVRGAPTHIVIDKEGRINWIGHGAIEDPETELGAVIKRLL